MSGLQVPTVPETPINGVSASDNPPSRFRAFASAIQERLHVDEVILLTTLPRGGLQVCRRLQIHEGLIRRYVNELHPHDAVAWGAILTGHLAGSASPGGASETPVAYGLVTTLAVRIEGPVFSGYPGVVLAMRKRTSSMPAIDAADEADTVRKLFDQHMRGPSSPGAGAPRQFAFDATGACVFPTNGLKGIDPQLAARISETASRHLRDETLPAGRVTVTDGRNTLVPVEVVRFEAYPALGAGPVVFISIHPELHDWANLAPDAFEADAEMTRLARAAAFMVANFRAGPTLVSIAHAVQLSQFHFHRRFSELFGVTPKHLLYDLQLDEAKRLLRDPGKALVDIAKLCGFAHQSHFTSRFKQGAGITPTRWRRQMAHGGAGA